MIDLKFGIGILTLSIDLLSFITRRDDDRGADVWISREIRGNGLGITGSDDDGIALCRNFVEGHGVGYLIREHAEVSVVGNGECQTLSVVGFGKRQDPPGFPLVWVKLALVLPKQKGSAHGKQDTEDDDEFFFRKDEVHWVRA